MRLSEAVIILLASAAVSVNAQAPPAARFSSYCGLLKNKIYCYGGFRGTRDETSIDSSMFILDISKANDTNMSDLQNSWHVETTNTAGVNTEKRRDCQYGVVGETQLVISGGVGGLNSGPAMVDQTIVYDAENNSWKKYPNYIEGAFGNRQIYYGTTTAVPSKGLAFYGGFERPHNNNWTIATNQNLTATVSGNLRVVGYTSVTYLDINNSNRPWTTPSQTNAPSVFSAFQSSIYHPTSNKIFYFGGTFEDTLSPGYVPLAYKGFHQFTYTLTFDTFSGAWANQTLYGGVKPSERRYHSTTLLPNGQSTVLLYGGERKDSDVNDYCFTLDLKTFTWTQQNIIAPQIDLRRSRHSAILVNNDTLFIVLGIDGVFSSPTSLPVALNVSNPLSITYLEKYTDPNAPPIDGSYGTQSSGDKESAGRLSTGAIAGIAVGSVAAAGIIAFAAVFFCLLKKKAEEKKRDQVAVQHITTTVDQSQEDVEVNWDEIEKQYVEMPTGIKLSDAYPSPTFANTTTVPSLKHDNEPVTIIGNIEHKSSPITQHSSPFTQSSTVSYPPPNSFDEVHQQQYITKPDSGPSL